jgi:uncharacterized protein (DUF2267 family)
MVDTGYASFSTTVDKANHILAQIEDAYGWPKERRGQSYAALRSVLHALRDRMTVEQSAHFAAQLPMVIRGMFYEGWEPSHVPQKMSGDEFRQRVREGFSYNVVGGTDPLVKNVLHALRHYVGDGEWSNITTTMPKELASILG